ncbi:MAG: AAA family ATPase [Myxococcota bacterium]
MVWIHRISLPAGFRTIPPMDFDLAPESDSEQDFRHLIVTGPNGSGKSSLLAALTGVLNEDWFRTYEWMVDSSFWTLQLTDKQHLRVTFDPHWRDPEGTVNGGRSLLAYFPARRDLVIRRAEGPIRLDLDDAKSRSFAELFLQFLVNQDYERTYAKVDGDEPTYQRITTWFDTLLEHLRWLIEDPELELRYDRSQYNFTIRLSTGFEFDLTTLADGYASVLAILAELLMRVEACQRKVGDRSYQPSGVVLIDEVETHLHLRLQEQLLPLLTDLLPRVQFIVATHSPAVIASIDDAVVYDLGTRERTLSREFKGIRYGTLMTEHFGIESDIDRESTAKLKRARQLMAKSERSADEERELTQLAEELGRRSATLALELWNAREDSAETNDEEDGQ